MYQIVNPATGLLVEEFPTATDEQVSEAVARSHEAYRLWRERPVEDRVLAVKRAGELFRERSEELAAIIAQEMGKRIDEGKGELQLVSDIFAYYAENGPALLADEQLEIKGGKALIQKRPVGSLIGVMPWNYPYYQVARFVAPNLVLGNTILLKHARNCPRSAAAIEQLLHDAGVPEDAYINVYATSDQIAWMLSDDRIQGISLTGSERAGAAVGATAGRNLKKCVLELGGSDPLIVLDTADMDNTVDTIVSARMGNNGQACNSPKRIIVMDDLYEEFVEKVTARMSYYKPGDPADPQTTLAPLSSQQAADELIEQIQDAVDKGASLLTGGRHIDTPGAFVEPAVLTGVTKDMRAYDEELFGPAIVIYRAATEDEAITLANDSVYGLGASVFSADPTRALRVGDRLESGMITVNTPPGSLPDVPFGGIKRSGIGRELGPLGIEEFMNKRAVRMP
jgi:succinate-semialdehyde dehydrogenase/glutarate-semialdehyde dehydrogenase